MTQRLIADLMKGERVEWPAGLDHDVFLDALRAHGATPLVAWHLRRGEVVFETALAERIEAEARLHAAHEVVRRHELGLLFDRFAAAGVPLLIIKGEALAQTHYAESSLRPRCDMDVLIERKSVDRVATLLTAAGYREEPSSGGEMISRQRMWVRRDALGIRHCIDLHWSLSNRQRYADAFELGDLWSRSSALHGATIRMPMPADALLIAALHLAAHHSDSERLIWLYDIHLLHASMSIDELQSAAALARERKIDMALDIALALALRWFGESRDAVVPRRPVQSAIGAFVEDLRWTRGFGPKLRLVREHLFPPGAYVLHKYGVKSRAALPALYVRRAFAATARFLSRAERATARGE